MMKMKINSCKWVSYTFQFTSLHNYYSDESQWAKRLEGSSMQMAGQLNADLAMSDSDDDDNVKRPRMDEDLTQF